jgi:hypothetical protein
MSSAATGGSDYSLIVARDRCVSALCADAFATTSPTSTLSKVSELSGS